MLFRIGSENLLMFLKEKHGNKAKSEVISKLVNPDSLYSPLLVFEENREIRVFLQMLSYSFELVCCRQTCCSFHCLQDEAVFACYAHEMMLKDGVLL